jgi:hypothetical protein
MSDVHDLGVEVDSGNDPVFVATNVKNVIHINFVGRIKCALDIGKVREVTRFNDLAPSLQRLISGRMDRCEVGEGGVGYDSHWHRISQIEIACVDSIK